MRTSTRVGSERARAGKLDPLIGRAEELQRTLGQDLRLVDRELAEILRRIRCSNLRFTRTSYHFSLNTSRGFDRVRSAYRLFGFTPADHVEFVCMYGYDTTLREDVERFRFLRSLPGAYAFVQEYQPVLGGPAPRPVEFFDDDADYLIDELVGIVFQENMKSMEKYYRWVSKCYARRFGALHPRLVDTIFRYNRRDQKGRYIASLAGTLRPAADPVVGGRW